MLSAWIRIIRLRFLLASVIAVCVGLSIHWWQSNALGILESMLTLAGVIALHASVDLLNDFWDFKRGIDTKTRRTKLSGGTGVLPEGLLKPSHVYTAGVIFLMIGTLIGVYFVILHGFIIAILLGFAIFSIYFYSTKIVDSGLSEVFVTIKGTSIVLGTFFIQSGELTISALLGGLVVGILSSFVLFITSFPDYNADKSKGRKTLVILLGRKKASIFFWVFPTLCYLIVIMGIIFDFLPTFSIATLLTLPLCVHAGLKLKKTYDKIDELEPIMWKTLLYSRITGVLFVLSFLINSYFYI